MKILDLPTWEKCHELIGGTPLTPLERFIYDNEPCPPHDDEFRAQLKEVLVQQSCQHCR